MAEWFLGRTSNGVDATAVMWKFFREHPLVETLIAPRDR